MASSVARGSRRQKWSVEFTARVRGDLVAPVGFSDRPLSVSNIREHDQDLVDKRCWDIAPGTAEADPHELVHHVHGWEHHLDLPHHDGLHDGMETHTSPHGHVF
ncbi:unnamed protein product, partial [Lampetra fluviatilis]